MAAIILEPKIVGCSLAAWRVTIRLWLYAFTTLELLQRGTPYVKVGMTRGDPANRILQWDGGHSPVVEVWRCEVPVTLIDGDLHRALVADGYRRIRPNREWFDLGSDPSSVLSVTVNEIARRRKIEVRVGLSCIGRPVVTVEAEKRAARQAARRLKEEEMDKLFAAVFPNLTEDWS